MSTQIFPTLPLLGFPTRTPIHATRKKVAISGKATAVRDRATPIYNWEYPVQALRQAGPNQQVTTIRGQVWTELATLFGFFNQMGGGFDTWLYEDPYDNTVVSQGIAAGDGTTTSFQMVRAFGGFTEIVLAPNLGATLNVYLGGTLQSPSSYTVNGWGSATPGTIVFTSAPGSGVLISADFSFYWACRFIDDKCDFQQIAAGYFSCKKLAFESVH